MHSFLVWLEATGLSTWIRESTSLWAFPGILTLHTIGMGFVAGINAVIALRILGVAPRTPLLELRRFLAVMWSGFWINAASGVLLLIGYPAKALTNPVFYIKLVFIALAIMQLRSIQNLVLSNPAFDLKPPPRKAKFLAAASLLGWTGAITAGRLLAYTYSHITAG